MRRRNAPRSAEGIEGYSSDFPKFETGGAGRVNSLRKSFYVAILCRFFMRLLCGLENMDEYVKEK